MTQLQDAILLAALELQAHRLTAVLHRLEAARQDLVPPAANFWRGPARHAYDSAIEMIAATADSGIAAVRCARDRTSSAVAVVVARG